MELSTTSTSKPLHFLVAIFIVTFISVNSQGVENQDLKDSLVLTPEESNLKRSDFPKDFLFGVATAAVQIEGAPEEDGKGQNIWDHFVANNPKGIKDGSSPNVTINSYQRYKEDVKAVKDLGVDVYRFSIPWTRILPNGSLSGGINQKGINHYNSLIDELVKNGITPFVTLLHYDYPQALEEKYNGPLDHSFLDDFKDYSEICFRTFGDRVKNWITINEPSVPAFFGYAMGNSPPARCSNRATCAAGDSAVEPYTVIHNFILAHATVATLYKHKFQATQGGQIGVVLVGQYLELFSNSTEDKQAQERGMDFGLGWFVEPLVFGDYPKVMREMVKDKLPTFSQEEKKLIKGSSDFIAINYYTSRYAKNYMAKAPPNAYFDSMISEEVINKAGKHIGPKVQGVDYIYIYPEGLQKILEFMKAKYNNPKIYISENGVSEERNDTSIGVNDEYRINFIRKHIYRVHNAIKNGVNVKGYFYWCAFDDWEWNDGFNSRMGLYYVDEQLKRTMKQSGKWYNKFLRGGS